MDALAHAHRRGPAQAEDTVMLQISRADFDAEAPDRDLSGRVDVTIERIGHSVRISSERIYPHKCFGI
jgi:hypothetical protein